MTVRLTDACSGCGSCLVTCPTSALTPARRHPVLDPARCTGCLACIEVCPVEAITEVGRQ
jgi:MinD superfamily P-loop ATPase